MNTLKKTSSMLALIALAALFVVGCGSDDSSNDADSAPKVSDAWARTTAPKATMGAAYMNIVSAEGDKLVGVEVPSDIAASAEIHETVMSDEMPSDDHGDDGSMESGEDSHDSMGDDKTAGSTGGGNTMTMREVDSIELPAGKTVELKPGGYHVMLIDLVGQIKEGQEVKLTLIFEKAPKQEVTAVAKS